MLSVVLNVVIVGFVCRVSLWFLETTLTWATESILLQILVPLILSVTDHSVFVSLSIVLICWLLFLTSNIVPMKNFLCLKFLFMLLVAYIGSLNDLKIFYWTCVGQDPVMWILPQYSHCFIILFELQIPILLFVKFCFLSPVLVRLC